MGVELTPDRLTRYVENLRRVNEEDRASAANTLSTLVTIGSEVWDNFYTALLRHLAYKDWLEQLSSPERTAPVALADVASFRQMLVDMFMEYEAVGIPPTEVVRLVARKRAARRLYQDLDTETVVSWLREQGLVEGEERVSPSDIEALITGGADAVLTLVQHAVVDGERKLAIALLRALDEKGEVRAGYVLTLSQARAAELRSEPTAE